jgi:hypothetical protein
MISFGYGVVHESHSLRWIVPTEAVLAYSQTPAFERGFSRLKNRPLGLRPLYLV